jgi:hypothetical protein
MTDYPELARQLIADGLTGLGFTLVENRLTMAEENTADLPDLHL